MALRSAGPRRARSRLDLPATGVDLGLVRAARHVQRDPADRRRGRTPVVLSSSVRVGSRERLGERSANCGGTVDAPIGRVSRREASVEPLDEGRSVGFAVSSGVWMAGGIGGLPSFGPQGQPTAASRSVRRSRGGSHRSRRIVRPPLARGRAIRELPLAERPRERLAQRGVAGLTSAELIGLVWGSGSRGRSAVDIASDALARHDGLTGLARATDVELGAVGGVGPARAAQLAAAFELGRRLLADWPSARWTIRDRTTSPTD